ncbi:MAG: ribonuclease HI [Methanosaeta sp. ASP1-1]|nr:MAG: ribonuclease HI [Methanosaeta sp. ASP1-1]
MITIYFDGLCYPRNPGGVAAYGYAVYRDGKPIWRGFGAVGEGRGMTNNVAEYEALMAAARWLVDEGIEEKIIIKGDSELVIKQMRGSRGSCRAKMSASPGCRERRTRRLISSPVRGMRLI